jgi:hypothetical protein
LELERGVVDLAAHDVGDVEGVVGFHIEVADDQAVEDDGASFEERCAGDEGLYREGVEGVKVLLGVVARACFAELAGGEAVGRVDEAEAKAVAVADKGLDPVPAEDGNSEQRRLVRTLADPLHDGARSLAIERAGHDVTRRFERRESIGGVLGRQFGHAALEIGLFSGPVDRERRDCQVSSVVIHSGSGRA